MKLTMEKIRKSLITLGIWLAAQFIVTIILVGGSMITGGSANEAIAPALAISDAIVILSLFILRYCRISEFFQKINPKLFFYSVVFGFFGLYLVDLLMSSVEIPNYLEDTFRNMAKSSWGFIGICLIGPVMEEMMLRRVIMKEMAALTKSDWGGILISASLFAIIHINPIQVVFALPAGIVLGWLYYKTGRIIVPAAVHVLNNTVAFIQIKFQDTWDMEESLNSNDILKYTLIILCLILTALSLVEILRLVRQQQNVEPAPEVQENKPADTHNGTFDGNNYEK